MQNNSVVFVSESLHCETNSCKTVDMRLESHSPHEMALFTVITWSIQSSLESLKELPDWIIVSPFKAAPGLNLKLAKSLMRARIGPQMRKICVMISGGDLTKAEGGNESFFHCHARLFFRFFHSIVLRRLAALEYIRCLKHIYRRVEKVSSHQSLWKMSKTEWSITET